MKSSQQVLQILDYAQTNLSDNDRKILDLAALKQIDCPSIPKNAKSLHQSFANIVRQLNNIDKNLQSYAREQKTLSEESRIAIFTTLIIQKSDCLEIYRKFSHELEATLQRITAAKLKRENDRLTVAEKEKKIQDEKSRLDEEQIQKQLQIMHTISFAALKYAHLNILINYFKKQFGIENSTLICIPTESTASEKAQAYIRALRNVRVENIPTHIKETLIELVILNYQINLLDLDNKLETTLPRAPEKLQTPAHFTQLKNWALDLQTKVIKLLDSKKVAPTRSISTASPGSALPSPASSRDSGTPRTPSPITINFSINAATPKSTASQPSTPIADKQNEALLQLRNLIKKILCHPNAIKFWSKQVWFGDKAKFCNGQSIGVPTGIKEMLECIANQESLSKIQSKASDSFQRTGIFCCGQPRGRTKITSSFYLLINSIRFNSPINISSAMASLNAWIKRNNLDITSNEINEPLSSIPLQQRLKINTAF